MKSAGLGTLVAICVACGGRAAKEPHVTWHTLPPALRVSLSERMSERGITVSGLKYDALGGADPGPSLTTEWITVVMSSPSPLTTSVVATAVDASGRPVGRATQLAVLRTKDGTRFSDPVKLVFTPPMELSVAKIVLDYAD